MRRHRSLVAVVSLFMGLWSVTALTGNGYHPTPTDGAVPDTFDNAPTDSNVSMGSLTLRQHAIAGAVARCAAQTAVHPLNVAKTMLQTHNGGESLRRALMTPASARATFSRGICAQALLSLPNGAINFCAMEGARRFTDTTLRSLSLTAPDQAVDVVSASFGTALGTIVSLPQSVINDQIMSGKHANLRQAVVNIGWRGLYPPSTWRAALLSKVPSYALNWACYQELRRWRATSCNCSVTDFSPLEDVAIGAIASSISVCVMIPLDTVKVRMTTLNFGRGVAYAGVVDAITRMLREEGVRAFYRGLPPRLLSVVPMTAMQFAVYEFAKRHLPKAQESASTLYADALERLHATASRLHTTSDRVHASFLASSAWVGASLPRLSRADDRRTGHQCADIYCAASSALLPHRFLSRSRPPG